MIKKQMKLILLGMGMALLLLGCGAENVPENVAGSHGQDASIAKGTVAEDTSDEAISGEVSDAKENTEESEAEPSEEKLSDEAEDASSDEVQSLEADEEDDTTLKPEASYYIDMLVKEQGVNKDDILAVSVEPFEGKGKYSAFLFVGTKDEEWGTYEGKLYFANENGTKLAGESGTGEYYSIQNVLKFPGADVCYFYVEDYYTTAAVARVFGVENGDCYEPFISGLGGLYQVDGCDFNITISAYDHTFSEEDGFAMGHTWKPYYFYYDVKTNTFAEYAGRLISEKRLKEICGFDLASDIRALGNNIEITDILERDNGIVTVNYYLTEELDGGGYNYTYEQANYDCGKKRFVDAWGDGTNDIEGSSYGGNYTPSVLPENDVNSVTSTGAEIDDIAIYTEFLEGQSTDQYGDHCDYAKNGALKDQFEDVEWLLYDLNRDGVRELMPRLYGSYSFCVYTIKDGKIWTTALTDSIFGSEGGFINTQNQYVGKDVTHAGREQYLVSEYDAEQGMTVKLYFAAWWEDPNDFSTYTYVKCEGDDYRDKEVEQLDQITLSEYQHLVDLYNIPNNNVTIQKF